MQENAIKVRCFTEVINNLLKCQVTLSSKFVIGNIQVRGRRFAGTTGKCRRLALSLSYNYMYQLHGCSRSLMEWLVMVNATRVRIGW